MVLTIEQKNMIIQKYNIGWTIKQISSYFKITEKTTHLWIKRYKLNQPMMRKRGTGVRIIDKNIPP